MQVQSTTQIQQNPNKKQNNVGSSIKALVASSLVAPLLYPVNSSILNIMKRKGNLPEDTIDLIHSAGEKALKETGLADKGAEIIYLQKHPKEPRLPRILTMFNLPEQVKNGDNAFCVLKNAVNPLTKEVVFKENAIYMPAKDLSYTLFHEIGHDLNHNFSKLGLALQKLRMPALKLAGLVALFGAFTKNVKPEEGKNMTKTQKAKNFVRDNAGKLSFAMTIPVLVEEAMATFKGQKLANKYLPKDIAKIVSNCNKVAFLTYLLMAATAALTSYSAVKIKDYFVAKKENKSPAN